ncbi:hypothetical protein [Rhodopseudomonas sp. B29]|uniref:hypothetical protein n=1 Tax=Rhodopseudomonas sp. B29 TaxID=95607 RepID=UPI0003470DC5|nr:hypothetical protein [Rhodopseudomonas sp. B29]
MAQIIRVFPNQGSAEAAVAELTRGGFAGAEIIGTQDNRGARGGFPAVRVDAPFGTALRVTAILERNGGTEAGPQPATTAASVGQSTARPAAPTNGAATAQPQRRDAELRTGPRTLSAMLGIPELISSDTYFSGFPLLIRPKPRRDAKAASSERS